jgi:CTD small phosphatase-like protein 2
MVDLPPLNGHKKTIAFDMDETLIHCVDDIGRQNPDIIIPIQLADADDIEYAGINIRPRVREGLIEANKHF